ncbi:MAG: Maf family nucleotide pyrophosphatase [Rikenellaceae bacterium]
MLLHNKLKDYNIILASRSPRRSELLKGLDLNFTIADNFEVDEVYPDSLDKKDVALYLSKLKADGYPFEIHDKDIIITADTVVLADDTILGKPKSKENAIQMIKSLCGKSHDVITGVTIRTKTKTESFDVTTKVTFAMLSDEEIEYYIETYKPYDKAGSYGIQEWIGYAAIEHIEGSYYNVMGLPIRVMYGMLIKLSEGFSQ